jgi:multidrug efflux system outer membrane protein
MLRRTLPALLLVALVSGCSMAPRYTRPSLGSPEAWRDSIATPDTTIADTPWWELFGDDTLRQLVETSLTENQDLKIAVERIEEARARYGFAKGDYYPHIDAGATGGKFRASAGSLFHLPEGQALESEIYSVDARATWELDFFGRIRNASAAEKARMLAADQGRRAVVITLVADVGQAYMELRDFDRRLEIARRTLESRREYVDLARTRFEGGVTPEGDLRQAESEYQVVRITIFDLEKLIAQKEHHLSALLGRLPESIARGRAVDALPMPPQIPAGLPSRLLERRPDITEAELQLIAANAKIGEAKALLFPRISLTGSFGYASPELEDFFVGANQSWNFLGNLLQPIFHGGQNRRRVQVTESQQRQAVYDYERTVIGAMREVEDALVSYHKSGEQRSAQRERVAADRKVLELAETRYRGGVAAYLEVLDAQRSLFSAEIDEAETIRNHVVSLIQVYKALGGGWTEAAATPEGAETGEQK